MSTAIFISIIVLLLSLVLTTALLNYVRDWRVGFLSVMLLCILLNSLLMLTEHAEAPTPWFSLSSSSSELAAWIISLTAFFAVFFLKQFFYETNSNSQQIQQTNNKLKLNNTQLRDELSAVRDLLKHESHQRHLVESSLHKGETLLSDQQHDKKQLQTAIDEKDILLSEIYQREKNDLQIISSLLSLQFRHTKDENAAEAIKESQNRIKSIALIHETLDHSNGFAKVDFEKYLRALTSNLMRSYGLSQTVDVQINTKHVSLDLDTAISCGLIINELVANCAKHAFQGRNGGEIDIQFEQNGSGQHALTVSDNGVGFPKELEFFDTNTLGLQLVMNLTSQLDGKVDLNANNGTSFRITFLNKEYNY